MIFETVLRCTAAGNMRSAFVVIAAPSLMMPLVVKVKAPMGVPAVPIGLFNMMLPAPDEKASALEATEPIQEAPASVIAPPLEVSVINVGV